MRPDPTESELLRLAQELDRGGAVDWDVPLSSDPALKAGIQGLREIESVAAALSRDPDPLDAPEHARSWLDPGSKLGRYPIEREAGRGGMGVVYLARDEVLDRKVALKLLPPDMAHAPERTTRFAREAKLLASLNHPNVATIHGFEEDERALRFLVLEWVAGESLAARLDRGPLAWREALEVCGQIASALKAAHEGGVIHRDLKPGNVMITPQGRVKVLDFGLARREFAPSDSPQGPSDPAIKGTWGYVSPECLTRDEDHRADVFAFGCVLYECLTGVAAFPGGTVDEIRQALLHREPDAARLPVDTPATIRRLIAACVVKDPDRRLGSMAEALRTIEAALGRRLDETTTLSGPASSLPHELPLETDAFVGRDRDLGELAGTLRRGARLVTLHGAGGMGKTRLAIRYGWRSLEEWPGGVWFCDLVEAKTRDGIAAAVSTALGVPLGSTDPVIQLGHAIAARGKCLIILDNFEQVAEGAADTVEPWRARAEAARFLITSRKRLGLPEEHVQVVEALDPEPAEELFLERARTQRPGFQANGPEAKAVREIVRMVDGMPLAIELAAARTRMMSSVEIAQRMRERFRLLAGTRGGRHGALRAVLEDSWELLSPPEQAAFAQCAVFEGGFTLAAAEAVVDLSAWKDAPWIPDVIRSLVDQSLLRISHPEEPDDGAEVRFGMLVSVHEYARAKLDEQESIFRRDGMGTAEERHARWFAQYGSDEAIAALTQHGGPERRRKLARELDNLVAACRRSTAQKDGAAAISYRAAWEVLLTRGPARVAVELGLEMLAVLHDDESRRRVLTTLGTAEWRSGRVQEGRLHLEEALALHQRLGDRRAESIVLGNLGAMLGEQGLLEEARQRLRSALAHARDLSNRRGEGLMLALLGLMDYEQGRFEEARAQKEEALRIAREVGDRTFEGQALGHLALLHRDLGDAEAAQRDFESALAIAHEVGNRRFEGIMLHNLGILAGDQGRVEQAIAYQERALASAREVGSRSFEGHILSAMGTLFLDQGRLTEADGALETASHILRETGERRFEALALGELGRLRIEQGRDTDAMAALSAGERILRETGYRRELGLLLCVRTRLEHRAGNPPAARATLREVEAIAVDTTSEDLGRELEKTRQALAAKP